MQTQVTYTLEVNGEFFLIENVPARVDLDTGEQFFAPTTVKRIQEIILDRESPSPSRVGTAHHINFDRNLAAKKSYLD